MKVNLSQFIRSDMKKVEEYIPTASLWNLQEKFGNVTKLDAGENQFGYSPKVAKALRNANLFNFYPDPEYKKLRRAVASYSGSKMKNIMVGAGSDQLIDLLLRLILDQDDEVINCPPTFGMYSVLTKLNRGIVVNVPRKKGNFSLDIDAVLKKVNNRTKTIFICSPNNPTGNIAKKNEIITLLKTGKLVIVDEAYYEFCNKSSMPLLSEYENLIILRTLSKWAGIAGLRLGYGIMNEFFAAQLLKIKPIYNLSLTAEVAGKAALDDISTYKKITQSIIDEREKVNKELKKLTFITVFPSEANLLFLRINERFQELRKNLESKKIFVRYYQSELTGNAIRLSIGTSKQNDFIVKAFREFQMKKVVL